MTLHDHDLIRAITDTWPGAITTIKGGCMIDPNEQETLALKEAGFTAAEFLGEAGTDMGAWQAETWEKFIAVVVGGYIDALHKQRALTTQGIEKTRLVF